MIIPKIININSLNNKLSKNLFFFMLPPVKFLSDFIIVKLNVKKKTSYAMVFPIAIRNFAKIC